MSTAPHDQPTRFLVQSRPPVDPRPFLIETRSRRLPGARSVAPPRAHGYGATAAEAQREPHAKVALIAWRDHARGIGREGERRRARGPEVNQELELASRHGRQEHLSFAGPGHHYV
jgi:hypothetical protein